MGRKNLVGCFGICGCAVVIAVALGAAPALAQVDNCIDGPAVAVDGSNPIDTTAATTDGPGNFGSPCNGYGQTNVDNDIWFVYTPTCTGTLEVDLCGGATFGPDGVFYDSRVAIYDGTVCPVDQSTLLACNDDGAGCPAFSSAFDTNEVIVTMGSDVLIRVGGFSTGDSGTGTMGLTCVAAVCGDGVTIGLEECDGADAAACAAGCTSSCTCLQVTVPALPPIGLIGLGIILLTGGALIFAWRPLRAEAGSE